MDWHAGTYERAQAIFDRKARRFHPIVALEGYTVTDDSLVLFLETRGGRTLQGRLSFPDPEVVRIQWAFPGGPDEHLTEMLVGEPPRLPVEVSAEADRITVSAGGTEVRLDRRPWRLMFGEFATQPRDDSIVEPVAEAGGWAFTPDGRVQSYETFALRPGEQLWGLGERFLGPGLRGRRLAHWIDEAFGTNTTDRVYKSVPLVVSSRGYGVFFHHAEEGTFDLGATSTASASVLVNADQLDFFVMLGQPKDILRRYTALTGRAPVPPEWTFGVWMSKCMYRDRAEVEEVLDTAKTLDIPVDVVGLDPLWLANRVGKNFDSCDFVWNDKDFGPLDEFVDWLHSQDVRVCLWVNPNVTEDTEAYVPERLVSHGRVRDPNYPQRAFVDFTGAGGDWWRQELRRLLAAGVDAFKLDYGECLPIDGQLADGRSGAQAHNVYTLLASITAASAGVEFFYTRSGTAGSQRYPTHWAGDAQADWRGLAGTLRGALALAWSGFAHWACDIGGFYVRDLTHAEDDATWGFGLPDPEVFIRWTQFGMLCGHSRFHGQGGREPWRYGDEAIAVAREFAALRRRLVPYLQACSREAAETGVPLMRPLGLEFPDDPTTWHIDTQFLLGPGLLVCPVLEPGGRADIYIPEGTWTDHFTEEAFEGPRWVRHDTVPLERIPLLIREGHTPFH